jgi:LEA14-like dessication related protein
LGFSSDGRLPGAIHFDVGQSHGMRSSMLHVAVVFLVACSEEVVPQRPTLTPEKVSLTKISPAGIELLAELAVENPNAVALEADSATAKVVLDGKHDLGTVDVPHEVELPSEQRTLLNVPIAMDWKDVAVIAILIALQRNIPYDVDGSVRLGGDLIHVSLPFRLSGIITEAELRQAIGTPPGVPDASSAPAGLLHPESR